MTLETWPNKSNGAPSDLVYTQEDGSIFSERFLLDYPSHANPGHKDRTGLSIYSDTWGDIHVVQIDSSTCQVPRSR